MLEAINRFFSDRMQITSDTAESAADTDAAWTDRVQVATCALLLEVAYADDEFSPAERLTVAKILSDRFGLDSAEATHLIELAESERRDSTDLYQFARLINEQYPRERKLAVLELLWQVVYSDGQLEAHEDALMHKLARLFGLRHQELIALKLRAKKQRDD